MWNKVSGGRILQKKHFFAEIAYPVSDYYYKNNTIKGESKSMEPVQTKEVDQFIEHIDDHTKEITKSLRELIFQTSPNITEEMKWGKPCYIENGLVCYLQTAKKMRHIRIKQLDDIQPRKFLL